RAVIATTIIFAAWMIAWLISRGGFGFSDVRITPLWAAPAAATGIDTIHATVIAGLTLIALYALIDRFRHHTTRFLPWAPSLCSGALIGLAIAH
ncbi:peptidase A24, partial [Cutibacterium acnes]